MRTGDDARHAVFGTKSQGPGGRGPLPKNLAWHRVRALFTPDLVLPSLAHNTLGMDDGRSVVNGILRGPSCRSATEGLGCACSHAAFAELCPSRCTPTSYP